MKNRIRKHLADLTPLAPSTPAPVGELPDLRDETTNKDFHAGIAAMRMAMRGEGYSGAQIQLITDKAQGILDRMQPDVLLSVFKMREPLEQAFNEHG